eukprot:2961584-Rhodomonas_salina.1
METDARASCSPSVFRIWRSTALVTSKSVCTETSCWPADWLSARADVAPSCIVSISFTIRPITCNGIIMIPD